MTSNNLTKRLFVLDTNVLIHDPQALFKFHEHDIYIPMVVMEELDANKKGMTEVARNVRQVNRLFDALIQGADHAKIVAGLALVQPALHNNGTTTIEQPVHGRLYFQTNNLNAHLPDSLPGNKSDNMILSVALSLQERHRDTNVTLVSKDVNLRIKATIIGVNAEDYFNDQVIDNLSLLPSGIHELPENFWESQAKDLTSWKEDNHTFYKIKGDFIKDWHINDCVYLNNPEQPFDAIVRSIENDTAVLEYAKDYHHAKHAVWGIHSRNRQQNFVLNHLLNPNIDLVTLQGLAGSGKTLLALAAGLVQTLEQNRYREIIVTRVTIPLAEDIGFLPGTEEEKMTPWMGALLDNLDVLGGSDNEGDWGKQATQDVMRSRLKVHSINFMRGRTFLNKYIIIDEAQNLTPKQVKTLITRAGPGSKIICLGDISQIDTPYLNEMNCGLTYLIDRFKDCEYSAHITLSRGERSRLADYAAKVL